jgi:DNA replication and repair protein RecF
MGLTRLEVTGFRCFEHAELEPAPGVNLVTGANASGKTSLLEAIFLLGRGRSFRTARREQMIREGADCLRTLGRLSDGRLVGMEVDRAGWQARAGGQPINQLAELASLLAVQVIDPEVHRLVQEGPGERRRYLDWATFHVKPAFLETWRRYQRALRQRNAALKSRQPDAVVEVWESALATEGDVLDRWRADTVALLQGPVNRVANQLLDADLALEYRPGQSAGSGLQQALEAYRDRDRRAGMTQVGPHRADLGLALDGHKARGWVSRGQQKLVAAALVLGQAEALAECWGNRGVLLVDDVSAELDRERCRRLLNLIVACPFQVFVTALASDAVEGLEPARSFHVEQARVRRVI